MGILRVAIVFLKAGDVPMSQTPPTSPVTNVSLEEFRQAMRSTRVDKAIDSNVMMLTQAPRFPRLLIAHSQCLKDSTYLSGREGRWPFLGSRGPRSASLTLNSRIGKALIMVEEGFRYA